MTKKQYAGILITLEGIEGVGKSTAANFIEHYLQKKGKTVLRTREPGGTPIAEAIRDILITDKSERLLPLSELLLLFAGRHQHIEHVIKPALMQGQVVLCDRYTDTSFAYQGGGRGIENQHIQYLADLVQGPLVPDCVIWLKADVHVALRRMQARGKLDRFEQEDVAFFQRADAVYQQRADTLSYYSVVDAQCDIPSVEKQLVKILDERLS